MGAVHTSQPELFCLPVIGWSAYFTKAVKEAKATTAG